MSLLSSPVLPPALHPSISPQLSLHLTTEHWAGQHLSTSGQSFSLNILFSDTPDCLLRACAGRWSPDSERCDISDHFPHPSSCHLHPIYHERNPDSPIIWPTVALIERGWQLWASHTHKQPAIYRGPLSACYPSIRPTALGKSGQLHLAWFHSEECPLVPLRAQRSCRAKRAHRLLLLLSGGVSTVGQRLQQCFLSNFMQQWCLRIFCCCCFGSTTILASVTVIFLMQATEDIFFFPDTLSQWKHDSSV